MTANMSDNVQSSSSTSTPVIPANARSATPAQPLSKMETFVLATLIIVGAALRWLSLEERPYHHDESLHGMYGRYFYDFPDQQFYKYDPMLHGPLLYNLLRVVYSTVGYSDWGARSVIALLGTVSLFLPLIFRRHLSNQLLIGLTGLIALSPTLIYWSRFLREDPLVLTGWAMMLYGALIANPRRKSLWILLGISVQFTAKENSYVTMAILLGFIVYEALLALVSQQVHRPLLIQRILSNLKAHWGEFIISFLIAALFFSYLYSAGFRHMEGILDGLYRRSIAYWWEHHGIERIKGPFLFHFYVISWYELPLAIAFFGQIYLFFKEAGWRYRMWGALIPVLMIGSLVFRDTVAIKGVEEFFKTKDGLDLAAVWLLLIYPVLVTTYHLLRGQQVLGFFAYLFLATLFSYSYLGEKVPWLTVYPTVVGFLYLALYYNDYFQRHPWPNYREIGISEILNWSGSILVGLGILFTLQEAYLPSNSLASFLAGIGKAAAPNSIFVATGITMIIIGMCGQYFNWFPTVNLALVACAAIAIWNFRAAILTNFVYAGHAREYLSQVHTTPEYHRLMHHYRDEVELQSRGFKPRIYVTGTASWPTTWYLRDIPEYKFRLDEGAKREDFEYLIQDWKEQRDDIPAGYKVARLNLRGWWVPDFQSMTIRGFLNYSLNHTPWNSPGYQYVDFLVKEKQ